MLNKLGLDAARKWSSDLKLEGKEVTLFEAGSFMCGFNAAIALLYAEVKPEELQDRKWYWIPVSEQVCIPAIYRSGSESFWHGNSAYEAFESTPIRGPILPPSEVLQAAEEGE